MSTDAAPIAVEPDAPKRKLRWYQYSLRSLLLFVLAVSVGMSWVAVCLRRAERQRAAVEAIEKSGGCVFYDYEVDPSSGKPLGAKPSGPAWLRKLLGEEFFADVVGACITTDGEVELVEQLRHLRTLELVGNGDWRIVNRKGEELCIANVTDAGLLHLEKTKRLQSLTLSRTAITDAGLISLKMLSSLKTLTISFADITDAGLAHLEGLSQLRELTLCETRVTERGVERLRRALPHCKISRQVYPLGE